MRPVIHNTAVRTDLSTSSEIPVETKIQSEEQLRPEDHQYPQFDVHGTLAFLNSTCSMFIEMKVLKEFTEGKIPDDPTSLSRIAMYALVHEPNVFRWLVGPRSGVTSLSFAFREMGDNMAERLAKLLEGNKSLTSLNLFNNNICDKGAIKLAEVLPDTALTSLNLHSNSIGDAGAIAIANALPYTKLTSLYLRECKIGDTGAIALANALPASKLTSFHFGPENSGNITAATAVVIADVLPYTSLTSLMLDRCKIGDAGAVALATSLQGNQNLTSLMLKSCIIGDAGTKAIATVLPGTALTSLDLGWFNKIGPEGAIALATSLRGNQKLTSLILDGSNIGDEGAEAIGNVLPHTALTSLNLRNNNINEKGAVEIATGLKNNKTFTTLYLFDRDTPQWTNSSAIKVIESKLKENQDNKRQKSLHKLNTFFSTQDSMRPALSYDVTEKILNYLFDKDLRNVQLTRKFPEGSMSAGSPDTNPTKI
jgi:Ran GTPase-activating protein (RanGAP) involved in mRNA processing and transport